MRRLAPALAVGVLAASMLHGLQSQQPPADSAMTRVADRIRELQREADALAAQEKSILGELRKLELQRQIKSTELAALDEDLKKTEAELALAESRAASLREAADATRPDVEARLVRLYKMGRGGHWRLLLAADDLRSVGRTYRLAATMMRQDQEAVDRHGLTVKQLGAQRQELQQRAERARSLRSSAAAARAALDRAVTARTALVTSIDERRDLAAQLTSELQAAQRQLQSTVGEPSRTDVRVPFRPFQGALPWPAEGFVIGQFGRFTTQPGGSGIPRSGIEISLAEGRPVKAIHEGTVTMAAPMEGYGRVAIVDHGGGAQSVYGHLSALSVSKGDPVPAGAPLGLSGRNPAGNPALYFELRVDGKAVDPLQWLRKGPA